jgi:hypothetical protein
MGAQQILYFTEDMTTKKPTFEGRFFCRHLLKMLLSAVPTGVETAKRNYFSNWR